MVYASALPTASDALLVVEVSDTTLAYDVRVKAGLYARHGVPVYWIVDLSTPMLRVFSEPRDGAYANVSEIASPGTMPIPGLEGIVIDLGGIL